MTAGATNPCQTGWGRGTSVHREVLIEADPLPARLLRSRSHEDAIPHDLCKWYAIVMSGTYQVAMGDRGRLVIPADLRERAGLAEGTALILLETPRGLVLLTRPQLQELVRADLTGLDLVGELLAERRISATVEDAA
jgi:AbrB family looped-hinge helix DNA binding protein